MKRLLFLLLMLISLTLISACMSPESVDSSSFDSTVASQSTDLTNTPAALVTSATPTTTVPTSETTVQTPTTTIPTPAEVITLTPEEAKTMIDTGNVTLVDVRRADEYAESHIPNALLVPNETILTEAENALPDKNAVILVYCRSGRRSKEAAEKLLFLGYTRVYDIGGILSWPYETE